MFIRHCRVVTMKLTVVIVNYNVKYYVEQCLHSLKKALEGINAQVYVVDNCSADNSVEYLRDRFKDTVIIENAENLGFSRANNIAIRRTESEYVLLLNPDTLVSEDAIRRPLEFMDAHPSAGVLGVRMLNTDGSVAKESRRGIPSPSTAFYKMCGLCDRFPQNRTFAHYYMSYLPWDKAEQIEIVSGAFCMLRRVALEEAGGLDEDFFMYGEDIDLSYRIGNNGWDVWYYPVDILHYKGESTQKTSFRYVHVFYQAMSIFFNKHYSHLSNLLSVPIQCAIYFKAFQALVKAKVGRLYGVMKNEKLRIVAQSKYLFVVSEENRTLCEEIASANGLLAANYITDISDIDYEGFDGIAPTFIIYDTASYGLCDILSRASATAHPNVKMGFFCPSAHTIITEKNVFHE